LFVLSTKIAKGQKKGGGGANSLIEENKNKNPSQNQVWENPTYKTYQEYLDDLDISKDSISHEDLTGVGTESNPYVVHNIRGFLYILTPSISGVYLNGQYLNLACDIKFNDETFDENGNPVGGDGIVYSWEPAIVGQGLTFNGCGHLISGLYFNDITRQGISLFTEHMKLKEIKNLTNENLYIKAKSKIASFVIQSEIVKNCTARKGTLIAGNAVEGIVYCVYGQALIENCINQCNLYATLDFEGAEQENANGIVWACDANITIRSCINYGNIEAPKGYAGGICGGNYKHEMLVENCKNYGELKGRCYIGGIVASSLRGKKKIQNCENYGTNYGSVSAGGIIGYIVSDVVILNCKVYGNFVTGGQSVGGIVGQVYLYRGIGSGNLTIEECEVYINESKSVLKDMFVGILTGEGAKLVIRDCRVDVENYSKVVFCSYYSEAEYLGCKNLEINLHSQSNTAKNFLLLNSIIFKEYSKLEIKNIHIKSNFNLRNRNLVSYFPNRQFGRPLVDGMLFESSQGQNVIFGNDFSDYFISWKTGKVGLKTFYGKGTFQSTLNKQWFVEKGAAEMNGWS